MERGNCVSYSAREAIEQRRRNWRIALSIIIAVTIPFYCAGVFLWGTAPQRETPTPQATQQQVVGTPTPLVITATVPGFASITPLPITLFPTSQPFPTLNIPTPIPSVIVPTRFLSPTPIIVQPTQPPPPTNPPPPTQPLITDTPLPFDNP
jgi:hypothetical protein